MIVKVVWMSRAQNQLMRLREWSVCVRNKRVTRVRYIYEWTLGYAFSTRSMTMEHTQIIKHLFVMHTGARTFPAYWYDRRSSSQSKLIPICSRLPCTE